MNSGSAPTTQPSVDVRDRLGFAVREINLGLKRTTPVSSRTTSVTIRTEVKRLLTSHQLIHGIGPKISITRRNSPVSILFCEVNWPTIFRCWCQWACSTTRRISVVDIEYLLARKYSLEGVELGRRTRRTVDFAGGFCSALRCDCRCARLAQKLKLGGPSLQKLRWPSPHLAGQIRKPFLDESLSARSPRAESPFDFFSFEYYPFDHVSQALLSRSYWRFRNDFARCCPACMRMEFLRISRG